jgi:hypothetical protein
VKNLKLLQSVVTRFIDCTSLSSMSVRWTSTYTAFKRLLVLQRFIRELIRLEKLKVSSQRHSFSEFAEDNWTALEQLVWLLRPINEALTVLQGTIQSTRTSSCDAQGIHIRPYHEHGPQ